MLYMHKHIDEIHKNCDFILDYLNFINKAEEKDKIVYYIFRASNLIYHIKEIVSNVGVTICNQTDKLQCLEDKAKQLEFDF